MGLTILQSIPTNADSGQVTEELTQAKKCRSLIPHSLCALLQLVTRELNDDHVLCNT
jgi:hypothetical protein